MWPFKRETRAQSFTDAIVAQLIEGAGGDSDILAGGTAVEEILTGLWGRAFASAKVTPDTPATRALTPSVLGQIGRQLAEEGESLWEIRLERGAVILDNAATYDVQGLRHWVYHLDFNYPDGIVSRTLPASRVIHLRYSCSARQPWTGKGPLSESSTTLRLARALETRLGDEASAKVGSLIPVPRVDDNLQSDINALKGKSRSGRIHLRRVGARDSPKGRLHPPTPWIQPSVYH